MERPQVRLIEDQKIQSKDVEVTGYEAEQLLRKYGYDNQNFSTIPNQPHQTKKDLTFEEMIAQEETKRREEEMKRRAKLYGPKPTTFDANKGYDTEVKYGSDEDTGFTFKVQIVSDMPIPKY